MWSSGVKPENERVLQKVLPEGGMIKRDKRCDHRVTSIQVDCSKSDNKADAVNIKKRMKMRLTILRSHIRAFYIYGHGL